MHRSGIWLYQKRFPIQIEPVFRLSLDEGQTPLVNFKRDGSAFLLKMESRNPTGSHKPRGLAYQLSNQYQKGENFFVISSTGNGAIALQSLCEKDNLNCLCFIPPDIGTSKLKKLAKSNYYSIVSPQSLRLASFTSYYYGYFNMRSIEDPTAWVGYTTLAYEVRDILRNNPVLPVYIFVGSGSTLIGFYEGCSYLKNNGFIENMPMISAVQIEKTDLLGLFKSSISLTRSFKREKKQARQQKIKEVIKNTGGEIITISDSQILQARRILKKQKLDSSPEGCACFAAAWDKKLPLSLSFISGKGEQWGVADNQKIISSSDKLTFLPDLDAFKKWAISNIKSGF